jgi:2-keto-4-pentenoate hydratase/2-oxohepta-3-ene-1,7-dioic acid hydratase in catechol pathway
MAYHLAGAELDGLPCILLARDDALYPLADVLGGVPALLPELLAEWPRWQPSIAAVAANGALDAVEPVTPSRWLVPVRPGKLVCIGTNYRDHLLEMGTPHVPELPYSFLKPTSTGLVPSGAEVGLPHGPKMVDWEAELAVVVGRRLHAQTGPEVLDAVAGYTILNDLSARDWIARRPEVGIDWVMMKAYDGFSPVGPLFTPREFVADPQSLAIRCWVNGELKQDSSTSQMVFGVQAILEHLSAIMTLEPGDVIATGTPAGVGFGADPQQFLAHGDTVTVEIDGLGRLETRMIDPTQGASA